MNGVALNEDRVNDFLNGLSKDHFLNMLALDHIRLREGGESLLQSRGDLRESLFSAASGINRLRKVFKDLENKSDDIYKKSRPASQLNKLLKEEKALIKEISETQLKVRNWKELDKTYSEGKKEIEEIKDQIKTLRSKQEMLKRVKLTLPKLAKLRELEQKFVELGEVPNLPDMMTEIRTEAQDKLKNAKRDKKHAEDECDDLDDDLNKLIIPEG